MNPTQARALARAVDYAIAHPPVYEREHGEWSIFRSVSETDPSTTYLSAVRERNGQLVTRCECPAGQQARPCKHQLAAVLEVGRAINTGAKQSAMEKAS